MNIALLSAGMMKGEKEATSITTTGLAKELAEKGNKVVIIAEKRGEENRKETSNGITIYRVGGFKYLRGYNKIFGYALGVRKIQKSLGIKFDVIHSFSAAPLLFTRGLLSKIFARKAMLIHTMKAYSRSKWGNRFYFLLNLADVVTVPTKVFANKLAEAGVEQDKIKIVHSNIDIKKFLPLNKEELKIKYEYQNKKIIFYYGAMWKHKGADYLVESIPKVIGNDNNKNALFVFAPRHNCWRIEGYKKIIKDIGMEEFCKFVLTDVKINEYVAMADAVVLPYPSLMGTEGNPSCLLEAMACKTLVVTTDLPELREIVDGCVLMAKPSNTESLVEMINVALNKPSKEMIEKAYLKSKEFDGEKICEEFVKLYH
ncbi:MAG: glycosyltransferase family 4 protein [Nanoarchaeota archaeon]